MFVELPWQRRRASHWGYQMCFGRREVLVVGRRRSGFGGAMLVALKFFAAVGAAMVAAGAEVSMSAADFAYYRQSEPLLRSILAGDSAAAERAASELAGLERPGPVALADVHSTIGTAYGEAGHFKEGIVHLQRALAAPRTDLPPRLATALVQETLAYGVYFHAALTQFEEAERLFGMVETPPPWLFAKLAAVYADLEEHECAIANADAALRAGRDGSPVVSHWAARHSDATEERDAVLEEWSEHRLKVLQAAGSEPANGPTPCVGGMAGS